MSVAVVISTTGAGSNTVPANCTKISKIVVFGAGGGGSFSAGGGGAYAENTVGLTVTPGATYWFTLAAGGAGSATTSTPGTGGGQSWVNIVSNAAPTLTSQGALAVGGGGGAGGVGSTTAGGAAASCVGTLTSSGGTGAAITAGDAGGGGGGAGGPNGNGNPGVAVTTSTGGAGGSGDAGSGGAGGTGGSGGAGGPGGNGAEFGSLGGAGGGGGGGQAGTITAGGNGGVGGGGGGGSNNPTTAAAGSGGNARIIIFFESTAPPDNGLGRSQAPWATFTSWQAVSGWHAGNYALPDGRAQFWEPSKLVPPSRPQNPTFNEGQRRTVLLDAIIPQAYAAASPIQPYLLDVHLPPYRRVPTPSAAVPQNAANIFNLFNQIVAGLNTSWCDFDLYTITIFNGTVLRYTTADFDINVPGLGFFTSQSVRVDQQASKVTAHWKVGLDVDTWTVVFMPRPVDIVTGATFPDKIGSVPFIQGAHGGFLDAADVQVDRAFFSSMPTWPMTAGGAVPVGTKTIFAGKVAQVDCTDAVVVLTLNDYRDLLTIQMPLHLYSPQCRHTLFDVGCNADGTMTIGRFSVAGTVKAGSTQAAIMAVGAMANPGGSGTYALGTLRMTSGPNATFSRTITSWDGTTFRLVQPFPFTVSAGDTFVAAAGCDLQRATCTLFGNLLNFGGFPYVPAPEVMT